jgi:hypothetical protein
MVGEDAGVILGDTAVVNSSNFYAFSEFSLVHMITIRFILIGKILQDFIHNRRVPFGLILDVDVILDLKVNDERKDIAGRFLLLKTIITLKKILILIEVVAQWQTYSSLHKMLP